MGLVVIGAVFLLNDVLQNTKEDQTLGTSVFVVQQGGTGNSSFTAGECLIGNGTGALTTGACGTGGSVTSNSLDFDEIVNSMTLDSTLTISSATYGIDWTNTTFTDATVNVSMWTND